MVDMCDLGFAPDPSSAVDVLAFVLCPERVFAPDGKSDELAMLREILLPMKRQVIARFQRAQAERRRA